MIKEVCGYAVPFNSLGIADRFEKVDFKAFDRMIAAERDVDLVFGDHSASAPVIASTRSATLNLFVDSYGVGFEAQLDMEKQPANWDWLRAITRRNDPFNFASIGELTIKRERWESHGDADCRVILEAEFAHIAICDNSASYKTSCAWVPGPSLDDAPWKIRELAAR